MRIPHKTTINALLKRKGPWRILAKELGLANYGLLNDIARGREGKVSIEAENHVREKLGLRPLTKSGNHVYRPRWVVRPMASHEQEIRRATIGASWKEVIEAGLKELEKDFVPPAEEVFSLSIVDIYGMWVNKFKEKYGRTTDGRSAQASGEEQTEGSGL